METEATVSEFQNMLSARGVSRRSFMKLCGAVAVAAGLSELAAPRVAQALEKSVIGATKGKLYRLSGSRARRARVVPSRLRRSRRRMRLRSCWT